jgi:hypothetical protein
MTVEEIYLRLKDELTAENESSSSPERIFIKNEEQTICTLGMNRSHEIIFVEFKPSPKDLQDIEKEGFVHPHPVEMLHDAGWRQAQITTWEEAEKLLEIIHRSYKRKRPKLAEEGTPEAAKGMKRRGRGRVAEARGRTAGKPRKGAPPEKKAVQAARPKPGTVATKKKPPKAKPSKAKAPKVKARPAGKVKPRPGTSKAAKPKRQEPVRKKSPAKAASKKTRPAAGKGATAKKAKPKSKPAKKK